jgi:hypothetical protein
VAAGRRVAEGVPYEVVENLADASRVRADRCGDCSKNEVDRPLGRDRPMALARGGEEVRSVDGLGREAKVARIGVPQDGEVVDEMGEAGRLLVEHPPRIGARREDAGLERLDVAADRGDRGAQLMRDVGDEVPPALLGRLERRCHLVERVRQFAELSRSLRHPLAVVAAGDTAAGVGEVDHWARDPGREDPRDNDGDRRRRHQANDERRSHRAAERIADERVHHPHALAHGRAAHPDAAHCLFERPGCRQQDADGDREHSNRGHGEIGREQAPPDPTEVGAGHESCARRR